MARSDRLFRLLDALRRLPTPVTAARLAVETGVSERTIYRDIETLRAGGAIIDGEAGYGYSLTEDPSLPPQMLDRLELEAVVLGLGQLSWMGDPALSEAADRALAKITGSLPPSKAEEARHVALLSYMFEPQPDVPPHLDLLREAAWAERAVEITYTDLKEAETRRKVWPLAVVYTDRESWLMAWCCLRQDFRRFKASRMGTVEMLSESFRPRRAALLREMFEVLQGATGD